MFEFFRKTQASRTDRKRTAAGVRTAFNRLKFECLESRRLLFAASTSVGDLLDLRSLPTSNLESVSPLTNVSLESRSANIIRPATPGHLSRLPLQPPVDGMGRSDWPQFPSDGLLNPPLPPDMQTPDTLPPGTLPDASFPGGFADIGELGTQGGPAGTLSGGELSKEVRDVLDLLSALQYVPSADQEVNDSLLETLAADVANATPAAVAGETFHPSQLQGGMIGLLRDTLVEPGARDKKESAEGGEMPLGGAVRMDGVYGRFQAFEVSTAEALPPPLAAPAKGEPIRRPNTSEAVAPPSRGGNPASNDPAETIDAAQGFQALEELSDSNSSALAMPDASGEITSQALRAAAAVVFLVYTARATRPNDAREPDRRETIMRCLPRLSRW